MSRKKARSTGARRRCMMTEDWPGEPAEKILWSAAPIPRQYAWTRAIGHVVVGAAFAGTAVVMGAHLSKLIYLACLGIGGGLLLSPVWHYYRAATMIYVLTDTQAVIDVGGTLPARNDTPLDQIRFLDLHLAADGFGDVLFRRIVRPNWVARRDGFIAV